MYTVQSMAACNKIKINKIEIEEKVTCKDVKCAKNWYANCQSTVEKELQSMRKIDEWINVKVYSTQWFLQEGIVQLNCYRKERYYYCHPFLRWLL